jgi:hypothetical protein
LRNVSFAVILLGNLEGFGSESTHEKMDFHDDSVDQSGVPHALR